MAITSQTAPRLIRVRKRLTPVKSLRFGASVCFMACLRYGRTTGARRLFTLVEGEGFLVMGAII